MQFIFLFFSFALLTFLLLIVVTHSSFWLHTLLNGSLAHGFDTFFLLLLLTVYTLLATVKYSYFKKFGIFRGTVRISTLRARQKENVQLIDTGSFYYFVFCCFYFSVNFLVVGGRWWCGFD